MLEALTGLGVVIGIAAVAALLGQWILDGIAERIYGRKD